MQKTLEFRSFLLLLVFVSLLFLSILVPFWGAIFWAIAISIVFSPVYKRILDKLHRPNLSALLTLCICCILVIVPFLMIASAFLQEGTSIYTRLQDGEINPEKYFDHIKTAFPSIQNALTEIGINTDEIKTKLGETAIFISTFIAQHAVNIGQSTIDFVLQLGIFLYITFFILRDSDVLIFHLHRALPLGDEREKIFFSKFSEVTRATIKGSLVVAMVQGSLGGLIFWFLDISAPLLWAVVMTLLSLVPMIGASLVWLPVAIYLFAIGEVVSGGILIAFGIFVIGLVDNILRPLLVGRDTKLPDYLVLLSTLGGFSLFGMNGFVIGPLVAALFITCWNTFVQEYNTFDK